MDGDGTSDHELRRIYHAGMSGMQNRNLEGQRRKAFLCDRSRRLGPLSRPRCGTTGRDNGPILRSTFFPSLAIRQVPA